MESIILSIQVQVRVVVSVGEPIQILGEFETKGPSFSPGPRNWD
ncbi:hypothetical protein BDA96_01G170800 [Sorghum bicolor]|uniref:Uncharacterized protein n=2 Tax=Sorghum bicolor TaxID=4558 RepID=A0A921V0E8_SORBI|nr:hypothetical protein BDA96_01G170800 [Sorghum bicolor]OQU91314.1 hypothetical protein SORBI_3001G162266 [Sorghum bicolor]